MMLLKVMARSIVQPANTALHRDENAETKPKRAQINYEPNHNLPLRNPAGEVHIDILHSFLCRLALGRPSALAYWSIELKTARVMQNFSTHIVLTYIGLNKLNDFLHKSNFLEETLLLS